MRGGFRGRHRDRNAGNGDGTRDRYPARSRPEARLKRGTLELRADWQYEDAGDRQHYLVEAWVDGARAGRAHGWYEPGGRFVLEKIELERAQRSRGYGSAVIEQLRRKARAEGCVELVFQGVRNANRGAIRLYESLGAVATPPSDGLRDYILSPP